MRAGIFGADRSVAELELQTLTPVKSGVERTVTALGTFRYFGVFKRKCSDELDFPKQIGAVALHKHCRWICRWDGGSQGRKASRKRNNDKLFQFWTFPVVGG